MSHSHRGDRHDTNPFHGLIRTTEPSHTGFTDPGMTTVMGSVEGYEPRRSTWRTALVFTVAVGLALFTGWGLGAGGVGSSADDGHSAVQTIFRTIEPEPGPTETVTRYRTKTPNPKVTVMYRNRVVPGPTEYIRVTSSPKVVISRVPTPVPGPRVTITICMDFDREPISCDD